MTGHYFVQGIFVVAGIVSLLAAIFNWDWFFTARNTQNIVRWAGRKRARVLYALLGIVLIVMAGYFLATQNRNNPLIGNTMLPDYQTLNDSHTPYQRISFCI